MTKTELYADFHALHRRGKPLALPNIWDVGSAKAAADVGAKALATSSWAVAASHGFSDGEEMPLALVIANLGRIKAVSHLPVTADFERGYGATLDDLKASFRQLLATCAVGCNLEDGVSGGGVRSMQDQISRIEAVREVANASAPGFFVNARTDLFLQTPSERHADEQVVSEAIERLRAYHRAGADGFFVPGLTNTLVLRTLVQAEGLPINVMAGDEDVVGYLEAGVARISFGPLMYLNANAAVAASAAAILRKIDALAPN